MSCKSNGPADFGSRFRIFLQARGLRLLRVEAVCVRWSSSSPKLVRPQAAPSLWDCESLGGVSIMFVVEAKVTNHAKHCAKHDQVLFRSSSLHIACLGKRRALEGQTVRPLG